MNEESRDKKQLRSFINAAHYIAGLTSWQDIWEEAGKVLLRFFGADFSAFGRYGPDGQIEIICRLFRGDAASVLLSESELKAAVQEVFESGFLTFFSLPAVQPVTLAFFPVHHQNRVASVMIVGHLSDSRMGNDSLDLYLAVAGLIGSAYSRSISAAAVLQAKEDWERTFEAVPDMIALLDLNHRVVRVNKAVAAATGLASEQCTGTACYSIFHCDDKVPAECPYSLLLADGKEHTAERHNNRLLRDFLVSVTPLHDKEGELIGGVYVARDITDRKKAEDEIRRLNADLEQRVAERTAQLTAANKELEAFAYSVSHDLQAPLRHMAGFSRLLQTRIEGRADEKSIHYANVIEGAAKKMGKLIDNLLSFSRMGRVELHKVEFSLKELILDCIGDLGHEAEGRDIAWHIDELPAVWGDPSLLKLVCNNLIANALKFSRTRLKGEIRVGYKEDWDEFLIFITDNGVGFDMDFADKLFGVFQRLHAEGEFEGTGIGLANVKRIISRHGGRTWAEGVPDKGATFSFTLPKNVKGLTGTESPE